MEYCGAEGPVGVEETALIFGKRERALAVWSMNGLLESSAMDVSETVSELIVMMNNGLVGQPSSRVRRSGARNRCSVPGPGPGPSSDFHIKSRAPVMSCAHQNGGHFPLRPHALFIRRQAVVPPDVHYHTKCGHGYKYWIANR